MIDRSLAIQVSTSLRFIRGTILSQKEKTVGLLITAGFLYLIALHRLSLFVLMDPKVIEIFRCKYVFRFLAKSVFAPDSDGTGLPRELYQVTSFLIKVGARQSQGL